MSQAAAGAPGEDEALAILCHSQTPQEKDTGSYGLAATYHFLQGVEVDLNPPASLGLFPCGRHINSKTTLLAEQGTALPNYQPHSVTGLQAC